MLTSLKNFDPIVFLNVNATKLSEKEVIELRDYLNSRIGEYILLKLSDDLTPEQRDSLANIKDVQQMLEFLKTVLQWEEKVNLELANFKTEYFSKIQRGPNG